MKKLSEASVEERSIATDDPEYRYQYRIRRGLEKAGYRVITDQEVGNYHLDLVVEGKGGRVAITCDGANEHPPERLARSLEREAVLERLGWRFLRARASSYYLDPEKTVDWVIERLEEMELEPPEKGSLTDAESHGQELLARVLARAQEILTSWYGEEAAAIQVSEAAPIAAEGAEGGAEEAAAPTAGKPGSPKKASSIAARLEKRIKKIRSLSPTAETPAAEDEEETEVTESSAEDAAARKPLGRLKSRSRLGAGSGGRLSGWRNLLPLQKDSESEPAEE